ncbi:hypothetical protein V6N12_005412 [Hibiscus sabdariffa]|uniref:Uncharacterized protein n=1 Tax=Hibiscus sabdariffa TaxID=183260 RepID=A0ABR2A844_9ROSI
MAMATFRNVAMLWGSMVMADEATTGPTSFDSARILIKMNLMTLIDEKVKQVHNGNVYLIQIRDSEFFVQDFRIEEQIELDNDSGEEKNHANRMLSVSPGHVDEQMGSMSNETIVSSSVGENPV